MKVLVVIPAFNESKVIDKVLSSLPAKIRSVKKLEYIVVDDGSTDTTSQIAKSFKVGVYRHIINRGLGAAIKTGLEIAKLKKSDVMVTFDSDGQHNSRDIEKIINPIISKKGDLAIGARFNKFSLNNADRFILNWLANFVTLIFFGVFSSDSQSGLRAFSKKAIDLIDYRAERMDFSSEILLEAKRHGLKVVEVPIKAVYTSYSRSKGQKSTNAFPVFARLLLRLLR